ncbi:MAG: hypothetical protein RLY93_06870 [Sumerlaeia bacterium]
MPAVAQRADDQIILSRLETRAEAFLDNLAMGRLNYIRPEMTAPLRTTLSPDAVSSIFTNLYREGGGGNVLIGDGEARLHPDGTVAVRVPLEYIARRYDAHVTFTGLEFEALVRDFEVTTASDPKRTGPGSPPYAVAGLTKTQELQFSAPGGPLLHAVLTLPLTASEATPVPAVVIVAGAKAYDADMNDGDVKMARDLAEGLAAKGVAALRFEKRAHALAGTGGETGLTLEEAHLADATAALVWLAAQPAIDRQRVTLAGIAFGAYLTPALARDPHVERTVLITPPPLLDVESMRNRVYDELDGAVVPTDERSEVLKNRADLIEAIASGAADEDLMLFGLPGSWWPGIVDLRPKAELITLNKPFAVLDLDSNAHFGKPWREAVAYSDGFGVWRGFDDLTQPAPARFGEKPEGEHLHADVVMAVATYALRGNLPPQR